MRELDEDPRRTARAAMVATYKRCHMGRVAGEECPAATHLWWSCLEPPRHEAPTATTIAGQ